LFFLYTGICSLISFGPFKKDYIHFPSLLGEGGRHLADG